MVNKSYRTHEDSQQMRETFKCDVCNKVIGWLIILTKQMLIHIYTQRSVISSSDRRVITFTHEDSHRRKTLQMLCGERPYKCDMCDDNLSEHMQTHQINKL